MNTFNRLIGLDGNTYYRMEVLPRKLKPQNKIKYLRRKTHCTLCSRLKYVHSSIYYVLCVHPNMCEGRIKRLFIGFFCIQYLYIVDKIKPFLQFFMNANIKFLISLFPFGFCFSFAYNIPGLIINRMITITHYNVGVCINISNNTICIYMY